MQGYVNNLISKPEFNLRQMSTELTKRKGELLDDYVKDPAYYKLVEQIFKDSDYKEVDGIYIIYKGTVDLVSCKDHKKLHTLQMLEHFGESRPLKTPSYEFFGDMYAGLEPSASQM